MVAAALLQATRGRRPQPAAQVGGRQAMLVQQPLAPCCRRPRSRWPGRQQSHAPLQTAAALLQLLRTGRLLLLPPAVGAPAPPPQVLWLQAARSLQPAPLRLRPACPLVAPGPGAGRAAWTRGWARWAACGWPRCRSPNRCRCPPSRWTSRPWRRGPPRRQLAPPGNDSPLTEGSRRAARRAAVLQRAVKMPQRLREAAWTWECITAGRRARWRPAAPPL